MYFENMQIALFTEHIKHILPVSIEANVFTMNWKNVKIEMKYNENNLHTLIENTADQPVALNQVEITLFSLSVNAITSALLNPEIPTLPAQMIPSDALHKKSEYHSFLYILLFRSGNTPHQLIGFMSSHHSRNYIKLVRSGDILQVVVVYDFINQLIKPKEVLHLEDLYAASDWNSFVLMQQYGRNLAFSHLIGRESDTFHLSSENVFEDNRVEDCLLFSDTPRSETIKVKSKYIYVQLEGQKKYLLDLSKPEAYELILTKCKLHKKDGIKAVVIKGLSIYLQEILQYQLCNAYAFIYRLLCDLTQNLEGMQLFFEDCPEGICVGLPLLYRHHFYEAHENSLLNRILKTNKQSSLKAGWVYKELFMRSVFHTRTAFDFPSHKLQEAFAAIFYDLAAPAENEKLMKIYSSMTLDGIFYPFMKTDRIFSLVRQDKDVVFIAFFNLSDQETQFFLDLSSFAEDAELDGTAIELYSGKKYLISNRKIYIRKIPPMDCCFIQKSSKPSKATSLQAEYI